MTPYTFFTLMCFLFGTGATWYGCVTEGKLIFQHKIPYDSVSDTAGVPIPDFELPKDIKVCQLKLEVRGLMLNASQKFDGFLAAEIFDASEKESCKFGGDIYFDYGVSEGESWTERVNSVNKYFRVDTIGRFSADVFFERGTNLKEFVTNVPISISTAEIVFEVRTGEGEAANTLLIWGIIFMCLGFCLLFGLGD